MFARNDSLSLRFVFSYFCQVPPSLTGPIRQEPPTARPSSFEPAVAVAVLLPGIHDRRTVVARVGHAVAVVPICLLRIEGLRARVAGVGDAVAVAVRRIGIAGGADAPP